jgi:hypothetical protein
MSFSKTNLLDKAIEIAKAYAQSGGPTPLDTILREVYEELKKLNSDSE